MGKGFFFVGNAGGQKIINAATSTTALPGPNNSPMLLEAKGFKCYVFQIVGTGTATITLYATIEPTLATANWVPIQAVTNPTENVMVAFNSPAIAVWAAITSYNNGTYSVWAGAVP